MGKNSYLTATDQFCGAGGTTTGAKQAGIEVKMALNHWEQAIETHNTNHPEVDHDCTDIQACNPRRYPSTDILFTSPECTNHSLAKGKKRKAKEQYKLFGKVEDKPEEERSRATMWDVLRFTEYHDYNVIVVENVVDVRNWKMWTAWLMGMHSLGYEHKCCYFNSMFFTPCPQSRDRIYVVFWKKGNPAPDLEYRPVAPCPSCGDREAYQWWKNPEKKWGKYKSQYLYRCSGCRAIVTPYYYAAFNIIDWLEPITRIGDRCKPLAAKTIQRIEYGLEKYGGRQMIVTGRYTSGVKSRVRNAALAPLPTQPGDTSHFLLSCIQVQREGYAGQVRGSELPLSTQTARQDATLLVPPSVIELRGISKAGSTVDRLAGITAGGINHGLLIGNYTPGWTRSLDNPAGTMTTVPTQQAILTHESWTSFLSYYYGSQTDSSLSDPLNTVTTHDRAALTFGTPKVEDCYYRCLKSHEVQRAMGFEDNYRVLGNSRARVKQLGNAVTPPAMKWIAGQVAASLA